MRIQRQVNPPRAIWRAPQRPPFKVVRNFIPPSLFSSIGTITTGGATAVQSIQFMTIDPGNITWGASTLLFNTQSFATVSTTSIGGATTLTTVLSSVINQGINAYATREVVDMYFAASLRNDAWLAFTVDQRNAAILEATRFLERQHWNGSKIQPTQVLQFPRSFLLDRDGMLIPEATTLQIIIKAMAELALVLLNDIEVLDNDDATGTNIKSLKAGSARIEYFRHETGTRFPTIVHECIALFLASGAGGAALSSAALGVLGPFTSGTGTESTFLDTNPNEIFR